MSTVDIASLIISGVTVIFSTFAILAMHRARAAAARADIARATASLEADRAEEANQLQARIWHAVRTNQQQNQEPRP